LISFDLEKNIQNFLISEFSLKNEYPSQSKQGMEFSNVEWLSSSDKFFLTTQSGQFIIDITDPILPATFYLGQVEDFKKIYPYPNNAQKLLALKQGKIIEVNLNKKMTATAEAQVYLENIQAFQIANNQIYYLDNTGYIFKTNASFEPREKLNQTALPLNTDAEYQIMILGDNVFLKENSILYQLNSDSKLLEKFYQPIEGMKISPDHNKLAFYSDHEIWVLFLNQEAGQPRREAGEKIFLTRFSKQIGNLFWVNPYYLIFNLEDQIKIMEIDNRDKINIVELTELKNPNIFWDLNNKNLYILSEKNLYLLAYLI